MSTRLHLRFPILLASTLLLASCATAPKQEICPSGTQELPGCPPLSAVDDPEINEIHDRRAWKAPGELDVDLIELGKQAEIPVQKARTKFLGPTQEDALNSLAVKLWMIENAEHTIDFIYYIFKADMVGYAMVGAMCDAVKRGVDIRVTVDSMGSFSGSHSTLKALETCADEAGFMRSQSGQLTTRKARVQVVIFNSVSRLNNPNRRSHDKLLIKDGSFESKSAVVTGGRNISEDYYGIFSDGSPNVDAYRDAEILIRSAEGSVEEDITVGELSEHYASILFLLDINKRLSPGSQNDGRNEKELMKARYHLQQLKGYDLFKPHMAGMDEYMNTGFHHSRVRLAHELANLTDRKVVTQAERNQEKNPNSIMEVLARIGEEAPDLKSVRIVSPYLFLAKYKTKDGVMLRDEAEEFRAWLNEHPDYSLEIVTNSVLTSDNFSAQSIIDMETAPRLLLTPEMVEQWLDIKSPDELDSELVNSETWARLISHPRLKVYETGRLDSVKLGGDRNYGKLHAKFLMADNIGFIGTTNFDYRSRLYNNEMGFFFDDPGLAADVHAGFDDLVASSYLWGSPEWFELRKQVMEKGGIKGSSTKSQRGLYKFFHNTGIIWLL